ncbi:MAG TPA: BrnT family toxin [Candidatus Eisenbacteria bacterium]
MTVFADPFSITKRDDEHSIGEWRWLELGRSSLGQLLVVVYSENTRFKRLISARPASRKERRQYEEVSQAACPARR